jgi:hypothetical protein
LDCFVLLCIALYFTHAQDYCAIQFGDSIIGGRHNYIIKTVTNVTQNMDRGLS